MHAGTRLQGVKRNKAFFPGWKAFWKIEVFLVFLFNIQYPSLRINKLKYKKILLVIQKRNHGVTEVTKNFCHWFNWGQGFTTGFTVTNIIIWCWWQNKTWQQEICCKSSCLVFSSPFLLLKMLLWPSGGLGVRGTCYFLPTGLVGLDSFTCRVIWLMEEVEYA